VSIMASLSRGQRIAFRLTAALVGVLSLLWPMAGCSNGPVVSPKVPTPTTPTAVSQTLAATVTNTPVPQAVAPTNTVPPAAPATDTVRPTNTLPPPDTATPAPALTETATITPTATATLTPTASIQLVAEPFCENPQVCIQGVRALDHTVEFTGTAVINNFAYYKLEYQGGSEGDWHFIARSDSPVQANSLYTWDASILASGEYRVALTAVDQTGNYPSPSIITIKIIS
jgi:hypothetical protein